MATEQEHRLGRREEDVDGIETAIGALVVERQAMRRSGVSSTKLEANRLQIACRQQQLSRALIRGHLGPRPLPPMRRAMAASARGPSGHGRSAL